MKEEIRKKLLDKLENLESDFGSLTDHHVFEGKQNLVSAIWRELGFLRGVIENCVGEK